MATTSTDMTIAKTILAQLGGHKFVVCTGARNLTGHANALSFRIPMATRDHSNYLKITLNGRDTYDLEFLSLRGTNSRVTTYLEDIYADQLADVFTRVTGLVTSLGTLGRV